MKQELSMEHRFNIHQKGSHLPVIIEGSRTPFVKSFGAYMQSDVLELYSIVVDHLVRRTHIDPETVDEIIAGTVAAQPQNGNVARDTILNLGLPHHIFGQTLNMACTSSLAAISHLALAIKSGEAKVALAGGVECLSDPPLFYSKNARKFLSSLSRAKSFDGRLALLKKFSVRDWIPRPPSIAEPLTGLTMGQHAEIMAKLNKISRKRQDEFAVSSHLKAAAARRSKKFEQEIAPVWTLPKFENCVLQDDLIREETSLEKMAELKPAFDKQSGTITAASSSPLTDGAAVVLMADEARALELGLKPKAKILDTCFVGVNPFEQLLIGPAISIPLLLQRNGLTLEQIDLFEIHEAFAAQLLSCLDSMESAEFNNKYFGHNKPFGTIPLEKLNVNGGAIAIGHPFGATGARLVMTLANELCRSGKRYGVIAICAAGGMAGSMLIERYN
jgi:acetyl-CoA acyltransferase